MTATDRIADRGLSCEPIYRTDMDSSGPADAISETPKHRRWRKMSYAAQNGMSGVMLMAGPETAAPDVTYPLKASGWHAVSVGVYGARRHRVGIMVRLSSDETFHILTLPEVPAPSGGLGGKMKEVHDPGIHELYWRAADLTNEDLVIGQEQWRSAPGDGPGSYGCQESRIAYVKLVPLTDAEVAEVLADRERAETKRIFVHNDSHGVHVQPRPTTAEEIRRHVEPYRDSDIARVYWESGMGDLMHYFTKIGRIPSYYGLEDYVGIHYRWGAESWRSLQEQGIDPFQMALEHAHRVGIEFHASYRVAGFHFPPNHDHFDYGSSFYDHHPEWSAKDRDGNVTPRLSYAYEGVRRFVVRLLREMAGYDVDGVCLLYNRRPPLVEYDDPVVEGFQREYGEDPRSLADDDPRWLSYRASVLTQFHREVREAMDDEARRQGRRPIRITAVVMSTEKENLYNAMDLKAWVDEGLVDTIVPYTSVPNLDSMHHGWTDPSAAKYFVALTKGTDCELAVNLMPRHLSSEEYRQRVGPLYDVGVENYFFWDSDVHQARSDNSNNWNGLMRLGHREEVQSWLRAGQSDLSAPWMPLSVLGDWDLAYETPG